MTGFWKKFAVCAAVSLLFCCLCIGFAQVTDVLNVDGTFEATPQPGVFITEVETAPGVTVHGYSGSALRSTADLSVSASPTIYVTVYNNSDVLYGYHIMRYVVGADTYDNENIQVTTDMKKKDPEWVVQPGGYLTFPVTYSYVKGASTANSVLNSVVMYEFLPYDELPENEDQTTVSDAMDRFQEILNTPEEQAQLRDHMENPPSWERNSSYISNVPGANDQDINAIEALFEGNLHMMINGEATNVKIMIKEENITNSYSGDEMVIYMTTNPLNKRGTAVVYRAVYANDGGTWIKYSEMQAGTATICDYSWGSSWGTGSFNTDTWKAS